MIATGADLVRQAEAALAGNRYPEAEKFARELLRRTPGDLVALQLLAEAALRGGRTAEGEGLLKTILAMAPANESVRQRYATLLWQQNRFPEALSQAETLLTSAPGDPQYRDLQASILAQAGRLDEAIAIYEALLRDMPGAPYAWVRYANALRALGRAGASIAAYRKAIELKPDLGEAWVSLANLKTFRFAAAEIDTMQRQLATAALTRESRVALHFALGKALGDEKRFAESFQQYASGNHLWRENLAYNPESAASLMARCRDLFTRDFFAEREGGGNASTAPIFIVGLPRAGSTLVEQILASHSAIEALGELPQIMSIAANLDRQSAARYPAVLSRLNPAELKGLGALYLESTQPRRKDAKPRFTDKMPNNFLHVGLIRLILPNAKIIDVRREAMACCFSNFTHHFARGQEFTYELGELGRFYADYVRLMDHYDEVLPGRMHRLSYEALLDNPEGEIRSLLSYVGLGFEDACLRFFEGERPVTTASSEQVRLPLYRDSLTFWRHYEPWLGPLKAALEGKAGP